MIQPYSYWIVDAFSLKPYLGNPAAVVFDADALTTEQMQTIARQFNLSESVFLCAPSKDGEAEYLARIFTPRDEMPFAGHPTIASAYSHCMTNHVESDTADSVVIRQECGVGIVPIVVERTPEFLFTISMAAATNSPTSLDADSLAQLLGVDATDIANELSEVCSVGLPWLIVRINSLKALQNATPNQHMIQSCCQDHGAVGLTVYCEGAVNQGRDVHVRSFAPSFGISEDPVCGSGNGAVAVHRALHALHLQPSFTFQSEQGLEIHRNGTAFLSVDRESADDTPAVRLGGHATKVMEGTLWM